MFPPYFPAEKKNTPRGISWWAEEKWGRDDAREKERRTWRWWKKKKRDQVQGHVGASERKRHACCIMREERKRAEKVYARAHRGRGDKKMGRRTRKESPKGRSSQRSLCGCLWPAGLYDSGPPFFLLLLRAFLTRSPYERRSILAVAPSREKKALSRLFRSGRASDCVITRSHTGLDWTRSQAESSRAEPPRRRAVGRSPRPPSVQ